MAKSFDLASMSTTQTQNKHNKYARYLEEELSTPAQEKTDEVKRINMAFTGANHKMIHEESERLGISMAYLVNALVRIVETEDVNAYIDSLPIKPNKNHVARRKGSPAKRINIALDSDTYTKIEKGSDKYEMTLTQYLNIIITVYSQDINE